MSFTMYYKDLIAPFVIKAHFECITVSINEKYVSNAGKKQCMRIWIQNGLLVHV